MPDPKAKLSIVVPAYNEQHRLRRTLDRIRDYAARHGQRFELIIVDDGSRDETAAVVREYLQEHGIEWLDVRLLSNETNRGKGFSVRRGMLEAQAERILMCDADLSAPIEELEKLHGGLDRGYDIAIGSRDMPDSVLDPPQPLTRRLMAWTFRALRRRVLLPEIRDTQCGFKLFRRAAAVEIFSRQTIDGWIFDCEVLGLAERLGFRIKEVGVHWRHHPDSRVRPVRDWFHAWKDLRRIRRKLAKMPTNPAGHDVT
jgi:dolichyl-phosphate beta-glucosyltransferase